MTRSDPVEWTVEGAVTGEVNDTQGGSISVASQAKKKEEVQAGGYWRSEYSTVAPYAPLYPLPKPGLFL